MNVSATPRAVCWVVRQAGIDQINGQVIPAKSRSELKSGDVVVFETPGGGGLYPPGERDDAMINQDLESGLTTSGASREAYGND